MNTILATTGSSLTKKSILLNKFDTYFNLNLLTHLGKYAKYKTNEEITYEWKSLELEISQRTDATFSNKITFNTVTKQDLLNLAAAFSELAETIKE